MLPIYDATVGLQGKSFSTLDKYDSAWRRFEVEVGYDLVLTKFSQAEIGCI